MTARHFAPGSNAVATGAILYLIATLLPSAVAEPVLERYMNQPPPGAIPVLFAPGLVNTDAVELNSVFTADGREFLFSRLIEGPEESGSFPGKTRPILHHIVYEDGAWSLPQPLRLFPDAPHAWAADMSVSPDGRRLFFMGPHPVDADGNRSDLNIWVSRREGSAWSTAEPLAFPVNTEANEVYSSVVADGSLYFTSDQPGGSAPDRSELYRAQWLADGTFAAAHAVIQAAIRKGVFPGAQVAVVRNGTLVVSRGYGRPT